MNNKNIIIALIIITVSAGFVFLINNEPAGETNVSYIDPNPPVENTDYIGMTIFDAEAWAAANAEMFRVVEIDGEPQPTTRDYRPGRINATVENDVVVSYTVEGSESAAMDNPYFQDNQLDGDMIDPQTPPNGTDSDTNDTIIGMTTAEVESYAEANDVMFRIGAIDGEFLPVTMDYRPGRITAEIEDDIVTGYTVE